MTSSSPDSSPILYSFRRCPYAMRARMALAAANIRYAIREVELKSKPAELIAVSPKSTVPVLVLADGSVIEQSLDIMLWALRINDPQHWLADKAAMQVMLDLIATNDGPFKHHLDRMKYSTRYEDVDPAMHRQAAIELLQPLEARLRDGKFLFGAAPTLADIAIFPFIRQFAHADKAAFVALPLPQLQLWLAHWEASSLFAAVMIKRAVWQAEQEPVYVEG